MSAWSRFGRGAGLTGKFLLVVLICFVLLEGLSSVLLFGYEFLFKASRGLTSRRHVVHCEELGWVNTPDITIEDIYGPGRTLRTNGQSLRAVGPVGPEIPAGKVRVVCVGDSFTFGVGVDDDHTWPRELEEREDRIRTVNLGEAGYGLDQCYLKYLSATDGMEYDAMVFAFIHDSFMRMQRPVFCGYYKPVLELADGELVTTCVPVPTPARLTIWMRQRHDAIHGLRTVQFGGKVARRVLPSPEAGEEEEYDVVGVSMKVFAEMDRVCREKGAVPLFVYLQQDRFPKYAALQWGAVLERECADRGLPFLNLASETQRAPATETGEMFDPVWHHYTREGNRFVARRILERLREDPRFGERLEEMR